MYLQQYKYNTMYTVKFNVYFVQSTNITDLFLQ